jgi:hypothetical protein
MVLALAGVLLAALAVQPATVTGNWGGTLVAQGDDGSKREEKTLLILTQKGAAISGTVGSDEGDRHAITSGAIEGNKVRIEAALPTGRVIRFDLVLEKDEMKGTISSSGRSGEALLKRLKK